MVVRLGQGRNFTTTRGDDMKNMIRLLMVLGMVGMASGAFAATSDCTCLKDRNSAIWVEGGATVGKKADPGVAVGVRFGYVGLTFGYGGSPDYKSNKIMDVAPVNPAPSLGITSAYLGKKTVDPAFGGDVLFFLDLGDYVTLFAGPGVYYQEYRNLYQVNTIATPVNGWQVGTLYNIDEKKHEVVPTGNGGVQVKIANGDKISLFVTVGYHTLRGVSGGLGLSF